MNILPTTLGGTDEMRKTSINLQDLRRKIYRKAKTDKSWRFWGLYVNYFRSGHSSRCFGYIKDWVEKKIRRHHMRAKKRRGFGWDRWSRDWLYETLGLFRDYRVRYEYRPERAASG